MIHLARGWVPHLSVLLAVSLVPVALHSYVGVEAERCENPSAIAPRWLPGESPNAHERYIEERMKPDLWRQGRVRTEAGPALTYTIARGFDAKHIYYRPEYKLLPGTRPVAQEIRWIDADGGRLPVHRPLYERELRSPVVGFAAYVVVYDGTPVESGYRAQLLSGVRQILRGRVPATLLFVSGRVLESELPAAEERAYDWLRASWQNYRVICGL